MDIKTFINNKECFYLLKHKNNIKDAASFNQF